MKSIGVLCLEAADYEDQPKIHNVLLGIMGSKPYYLTTYQTMSNNVDIFIIKYSLNNGFTCGIEILENKPVSTLKGYRNNGYNAYSRRRMVITSLDAYYKGSKTDLIRSFNQEVERYCPEEIKKLYIVLVDPKNREEGIQNYQEFKKETKQYDSNAFYCFTDKDEPSPFQHLFIDIFYASLECQIYQFHTNYHISNKNGFSLEYELNHNLNQKKDQDIIGILTIVNSNGNSNNSKGYEDNFFRVFRNKILFKKILGMIKDIHVELGYHFTEIRRYSDLSLYFLLHNNYHSTLIDMLKYGSLKIDLFCQVEFLEVLFKSNTDLNIIRLYIDRFISFCQLNITQILQFHLDMPTPTPTQLSDINNYTINSLTLLFNTLDIDFNPSMKFLNESIQLENKEIVKYLLQTFKLTEKFKNHPQIKEFKLKSASLPIKNTSLQKLVKSYCK